MTYCKRFDNSCYHHQCIAYLLQCEVNHLISFKTKKLFVTKLIKLFCCSRQNYPEEKLHEFHVKILGLIHQLPKSQSASLKNNDLHRFIWTTTCNVGKLLQTLPRQELGSSTSLGYYSKMWLAFKIEKYKDSDMAYILDNDFNVRVTRLI